MARKRKKETAADKAERRERERLKKAQQRAKRKALEQENGKEGEKPPKRISAGVARHNASGSVRRAIEETPISPINPDSIEVMPLNTKALLVSMIMRLQAIITVDASAYLNADGKELPFRELSDMARLACTAEREGGRLMHIPPTAKTKENARKFLGQILQFSGTLEELTEDASDKGGEVIFEDVWVDTKKGKGE